jgi:HPt (histidine-containing phosphotransfer) domain-containing protein
MEKIREILCLPEVENPRETQQPKQEEIATFPDAISFEDLREMSNGDMAFYTEMLETFEQSTSSGVEKIESAVSEKDWRTAGEVAHRICAPCKHLSANTLYTYLKEMEENCLNEIHLETIPELLEKIVNESQRVCLIIQNERLSSHDA